MCQVSSDTPAKRGEEEGGKGSKCLKNTCFASVLLKRRGVNQYSQTCVLTRDTECKHICEKKTRELFKALKQEEAVILQVQQNTFSFF